MASARREIDMNASVWYFWRTFEYLSAPLGCRRGPGSGSQVDGANHPASTLHCRPTSSPLLWWKHPVRAIVHRHTRDSCPGRGSQGTVAGRLEPASSSADRRISGAKREKRPAVFQDAMGNGSDRATALVTGANRGVGVETSLPLRATSIPVGPANRDA